MSQTLTGNGTPQQIGSQSGSPPVQTSGRNSVLIWCLNSLPAMFVLSGLAAVAWWGHHHDWKLPKFSEITGIEVKQTADWCPEHGVPESVCVICQETDTKKPKGFGWCKVHGVSECPLEHPEVAELATIPQISDERLMSVAEALSIRSRQNNNSKCKTHERIIQVPSVKSLEKTGVEIDVASEQPLVESITPELRLIFFKPSQHGAASW